MRFGCLASERVPFIGGVAAQVSLLMHHPDFPSYDWSAVKGLIVGAGPSPAALVREARERFGARLFGALLAHRVRRGRHADGLRRTRVGDARLGRPTAARHRDRDPRSRRPTPSSARTRSAGSAFDPPPSWPATGATRRRRRQALDAEGWLRTGDLGFIGTDGLLRITGRIGEMYIRGGYNVFPLEVESVLLEHPAVASVAVDAHGPATVMGEIGVAVVVPRRGRAADAGGAARLRRRATRGLQAAGGDPAGRRAPAHEHGQAGPAGA